MYCLDVECFLDLPSVVDGQEEAERLLTVQLNAKRLSICEAAEWELREMDDGWYKWIIANRLKGIPLTPELQSVARDVLQRHPGIINIFRYRGQTAPFSLAVCLTTKSDFVYPTKSHAHAFAQIRPALNDFGIKYVDFYSYLREVE